MASSSLRVASLPGPPPTPTSVLDLPQPWLLKLAACKGLDGQGATLLALFRTCTFFRDAVLRHRTAIASFNVPIAAEDFPAEVERLCAVARRSSNVRLRFEGQGQMEDARPWQPWTETEPCITHLLVCAMAQLEGEQPLACIKEIHLWVSRSSVQRHVPRHPRSVTSRSASRHVACIAARLQDVEQTALVPAWVKVLCPNAAELELGWDALAPHPLHQPRPHPHLQHLRWERTWDADQDPPLAEHVRQQLAALPSLTSLALRDLSWEGAEGEDGERQARRLISGTVTRLEFPHDSDMEGTSRALVRLPTQFPNLRELRAWDAFVDDDGLEALLRLPHLERLRVRGFDLQRSHAHRVCLWADLRVGQLDVGSFARLPLDGIPVCSDWWLVRPSADEAAVTRVAQAIRRWCGMGGGMSRLDLSGEDVAALVTTLGPLLAALPAEQQRRVTIHDVRDATPQQVQQLGQRLPPTVAMLTLDSYTLAPDAWSALLPSLPATVEELRLRWIYPALTEQQVVTLCQAAVRPVTVVVHLSMGASGLSERDLERIRSLLTGPGPGPSLVTLVEHLE